MHVLVAPDRIGPCTATEVAAAIASGWRSYDSAATLDVVPLSDGGPGLLDALAAAGVGERCELAAGPVQRSVDGTVYVEPALATDPLDELLAEVLSELDPSRVVVGVGGSTVDPAGERAADRLRGWPSTVPLAVAADAGPALPSLGAARRARRHPGERDPGGGGRGPARRPRGCRRPRRHGGVRLRRRLADRTGPAWRRLGRPEGRLPRVVLAERVLVGRREFAAAGVDAAYELGPAGPASGSLAERLTASAERVARTWTGGGR